jgi:hypothetical protein
MPEELGEIGMYQTRMVPLEPATAPAAFEYEVRQQGGYVAHFIPKTDLAGNQWVAALYFLPHTVDGPPKLTVGEVPTSGR